MIPGPGTKIPQAALRVAAKKKKEKKVGVKKMTLRVNDENPVWWREDFTILIAVSSPLAQQKNSAAMNLGQAWIVFIGGNCGKAI